MPPGTKFPYNPSTSIPNLSGKVILITGANTGLGKATALELSKHSPSSVWMASRDVTKGQKAVSEVQAIASPGTKIHFLQLDLSSFASVKAAAKAFLMEAKRLDILYLNAGIFGAPAALTEDGYEVHIGVNHLGHALLLKLLTPPLISSAASSPISDVRVVSLTSIGYKYSPDQGLEFDTFKSTQGATPVMRYVQSKLANLLYAQEVAERYPQFKTVAVHPGEIGTELFSREPGDEQVRHLQTEVAPLHDIGIEEGVKNQLWAGTAPDVVSGTYYEPVGVGGVATGLAHDHEMQRKLWEWTEAELDGHEL